MSAVRVLYVEDDDRLARLTSEYLESHGIEVHRLSRGEQAVAEIQRLRPDVVLLDLMLPGIDGLEICRQVRARHDVPIIMVTARTENADRVRGLDGGADDYVSKPFQSSELLARVRAQARRARGEVGPRTTRLTVGDLTVDLTRREVTLAGKPISLTTSELEVVAALAQRAGRVLSREQLLEVVHGTLDRAFDRSIDVIVARIRSKLEEDPRNPRILKTVRGAGYTLTSSEP